MDIIIMLVFFPSDGLDYPIDYVRVHAKSGRSGRGRDAPGQAAPEGCCRSGSFDY